MARKMKEIMNLNNALASQFLHHSVRDLTDLRFILTMFCLCQT